MNFHGLSFAKGIAPLRHRFMLALRAASASVRRLGALASLALLASCGFVMHGQDPLPFDTFYTTVAQNSKFGADLRRQLRAISPQTKIVETPKDADARLIVISNNRSLREVSLNSAGRVEQYELTIIFVFRLVDSKGNALLPDTTLVSTRELPYNDTIVQAKQGEIERLYNIMQNSLVDRIIRRVSSSEVREAVAHNRSTITTGDTTAADKRTGTSTGTVTNMQGDSSGVPLPPGSDADYLPWSHSNVSPVQPSW